MRLDLLLLLSFFAIIVTLIACTAPPNPTPTLPPTLFPTVTLTVYNPQLITTLTPDSLPSATIIPASVPFDTIAISPPLCYPVGSEQHTCLGYVENQGESAIGDVTLQANFVSEQGEISDEQLFTLEQRIIDTDDVAPYRIQIPTARLDDQFLQIEVATAELSPISSLQLRLLDMQGEYHLEDNRYAFSAQLENSSAFIATNIRLIVTLENADGNIIGYRVADLPDDLASGAVIPIQLLMTPLEATTTIRHRITLEAFPLNTSPTPEG